MAGPKKTKQGPPAPPPKRIASTTPEGDRQGYSYGRGKGAPTLNVKKAGQSISAATFRAGERASAAKATGRSNAKRVVVRGPTVGGAANAVGKAVSDAAWGANKGVQGALKSSPGLRSKGIENVMKLQPKRR